MCGLLIARVLIVVPVSVSVRVSWPPMGCMSGPDGMSLGVGAGVAGADDAGVAGAEVAGAVDAVLPPLGMLASTTAARTIAPNPARVPKMMLRTRWRLRGWGGCGGYSGGAWGVAG